MTRLLLISVLLSRFAFAQAAPWEAPGLTSDPAATVSLAQHIKAEQYAPVTMLLDENLLSFDAADRMKWVMHRVYRVETQEAVHDWSSISVRWSPWRQKQPIVRARVISPDGATHVLDPKVLSESPVHPQAPDIYEDDRVYGGPLPAVATGSLVEVEVTREDTAPEFDGGQLQRVYLGSSVPVQRTVLVVKAPTNTPLLYKTHLLPGVSEKKIENGDALTIPFEQGRCWSQHRIRLRAPGNRT